MLPQAVEKCIHSVLLMQLAQPRETLHKLQYSLEGRV